MMRETLSAAVDHFRAHGVAVYPENFQDNYSTFLQQQRELIFSGTIKVRPWHLWGLHNPWGRAATLADSWSFLDLCQSTDLLELVTTLIGEDIVLYDSQFYPQLPCLEEAVDHWQCDRLRCPVVPLAGLVLRLAVPVCGSGSEKPAILHFRDTRVDGEKFVQRLELVPGQIVCHDICTEYRLETHGCVNRPLEFLIRYFPASSKYLRDMDNPVHRRLSEQYPLLNYARLPLWLVHGEDRVCNDFVTGFQSRSGRWIQDVQ